MKHWKIIRDYGIRFIFHYAVADNIFLTGIQYIESKLKLQNRFIKTRIAGRFIETEFRTFLLRLLQFVKIKQLNNESLILN